MIGQPRSPGSRSRSGSGSPHPLGRGFVRLVGAGQCNDEDRTGTGQDRGPILISPGGARQISWVLFSLLMAGPGPTGFACLGKCGAGLKIWCRVKQCH
jgi:hypothetical protein